MNEDLISRQAAIDVLAEMQGRCTTKAALIQNSKIWQQIKDLPSADIDLSDYSDRLWRNAYEQGKAVSKDALDEAYAHGYTAAEADFHKQNQWIPVTERLPDDDSACFVTVKYRDIRYTDIAHCFASKDNSVRDWVGANDDDVLAWMPLPKPWKGGEE